MGVSVFIFTNDYFRNFTFSRRKRPAGWVRRGKSANWPAAERIKKILAKEASNETKLNDGSNQANWQRDFMLVKERPHQKGRMINRIAFSCTCHPKRKEAKPQRIKEWRNPLNSFLVQATYIPGCRESEEEKRKGRRRRKKCFLFSFFFFLFLFLWNEKLTIIAKAVNNKEDRGEMSGRTRKAVSPTNPLVDEDISEGSTFMIFPNTIKEIETVSFFYLPKSKMELKKKKKNKKKRVERREETTIK